MHTFVLCPQFFCLLKPEARVCTQRWLKMSWVLSLPLPTACPEPCNKPPFSAFTRPLYLAFKGGWPGLAYEISGIWVLGPKLWSQSDMYPPLLYHTKWSHGSDNFLCSTCSFLLPPTSHLNLNHWSLLVDLFLFCLFVDRVLLYCLWLVLKSKSSSPSFLSSWDSRCAPLCPAAA
jgi:hypothetical protein